MFADFYFKKFDYFPVSIIEAPDPLLNISVVIPCFDEPDLLKSLESLSQCELPECAIEVIVIINSSESADEKALLQNVKSFNKAQLWSLDHKCAQLKFHIIHTPGLKKKEAGVGLARKIGMDAALSRFNILNKPEGLIVGFDADAIIEKNYFIEIEKHFIENPKSPAASIYFEHPISGSDFDQDIFNGIIQYELHLRYFNQALKYCGFPYAFHTIGSAFVVKASAYAKQGGMNKKQAGEDFYFLHKIIPLGNYSEIKTTKVIPSPRSSHRVPFGTGAALQKWLDSNNENFYTYHIDAIDDLNFLFKNIHLIYKKNGKEVNDYYLALPLSIQSFVTISEFIEKINEINANSTELAFFKKRFFAWFDAFKIIRFLNTLHLEFYNKMPVSNEAEKLLQRLNIVSINENALSLLQTFRAIELST